MAQQDENGNVYMTRDEYAQYWNNAQKGVFSQEIYDRAEQLKLGDDLRKIIKQTHPNVPQRGFDEQRMVNERINAFEKKMADKEKAEKDKAEDDDWNKRMNGVRDTYRLDDAGMKELDTFMRQEKVANPEIAAAEMNRRSPRMMEASNGFGSPYMNFQKQDGWDEIARNPEKWANDLIFKAAKRQEEAEKNRRF